MEEKSLFEYLIKLDRETVVLVYIYINDDYKLVIVDKVKNLLLCLSKEMLKTHFYLCGCTLINDGKGIVDIYIQELA